ncbi:MAG: BamA/TamA family outer membrane protein [Geobacteraceae bacterium]|nr:BamA/TamA family outer membrane protein [Geobacteraceae bacterium]
MATGNPRLFRKQSTLHWLLFVIFLVLFLLNLALTTASAAEESAVAAGQKEVTFPIRRFVISGNTVFPRDELRELLDDLRGDGRTAAAVEQARERLEKFHHDRGYPTVIVNIPEQSVEGGFVYLQVIEQRIGAEKVAGLRHFPEETVRQLFPSLAEGQIPHVPTITEEFARANRNPDLRITPGLAPSKEAGTVEVELKVEDRFPLHGSLELNNRASHDTTELRLNAALRYDNLWQREHSVGVQYQTSPEKPSEVQVLSGSYVLPDPWHDDRRIVFYGVWSDTDTIAAVGDIQTIGRGFIAGGRYLMPLPKAGDYNHSVTLGVDYKKFRETAGFTTEVSYLPFSLGYDASLADSSGLTIFNAGLSMAFRGAVTDQIDMVNKRGEAKGNFLTGVLGVERQQKLSFGMEAKVRADGQLASEPLVANEQYAGGGMESVRGYKESEALGDNAAHASVELAAPSIKPGDSFQLTPYLFYDVASLWLRKPLPEETRNRTLQGTGIGVRGTLFGHLGYEVALAFALADSDRIEKGDNRLHFMVNGQF